MEIEGLDLSTFSIIHDMTPYKKKIPHEWIFTNLLLRKHLKETAMDVKFVSFVEQYFPKYLWQCYNFYDIKSMIVLECSLVDFIFKKHYRYNFCVKQKDLDLALKFGGIVTEFFIRYLNYSLIGCGGSKSIITAQDNCDKRFNKFLSKGYWLNRMSKIYYVPVKHDIIGYYKELPVLPTANLYYGNDEFIQNANHGFSKVLKY